MEYYDVVVIGAGAAGLMCAIEAGKRGRSVCVIDHSEKIGEKIRISGGGRCNFTNRHTTHKNFLSQNPRFCISALSQYTQHDFIKLVEKHGIAYHEKTLGQLFCDGIATEVIDMLLSECSSAGVRVLSGEVVEMVTKSGDHYEIDGENRKWKCQSLVIATGGKSIPKIGATGFGYQIAEQFGLNIIETRPALVPFTFGGVLQEGVKELSGISVEAVVKCKGMQFREALLFTHRGLSGPAILQISSYWREGEDIEIDHSPDQRAETFLKSARSEHPKQDIQTVLGHMLPKKLAVLICNRADVQGRIADLSNKALARIDREVHHWTVKPGGTEGYRTAEVTLGGVDTKGLSSKTMEARQVPGLYFIGEVVDVTGHLGGFNFQWAWSSGYAAGQYV